MPSRTHIIFDPIYGFIRLTRPEWEIIHSPFYQRLRWIKQLGFSYYVFPGAEHSRYGHSIGVLNNAHRILRSCSRGVTDGELFDQSCQRPGAVFHRSVRMAALMHDLGTFPFSHTLETAYMEFGQSQKKAKKSNNQKKEDKQRPSRHDHESLGHFIILNTDFDGGITQILTKHGLDPKQIALLVKGVDPNILANQILHSEIDCDRMDYLLRDAHYTGLKYGTYDHDYLVHHFEVSEVGEHEVLTIKQNALHCVEDFLMARFAWYSQVIRSARGAKFDAIAEEITKELLEKNMMHSYEELQSLVIDDPMKFYAFNDGYFMSKVMEYYRSSKYDNKRKMKALCHDLLFERSPFAVKCKEFDQVLLNQNDRMALEKVQKKASEKVAEIEEILRKDGNDNHWIVADLPKKEISFIRSHYKIVEGKASPNVLLERDPVKIRSEDGQVKLLADVESSIISRLQDVVNYVPNVFCSESAYQLLKEKSVIS